jgi:hypothetical protein
MQTQQLLVQTEKVAALRGLARQLAPARLRAARPDAHAESWTPPPLAIAR